MIIGWIIQTHIRVALPGSLRIGTGVTSLETIRGRTLRETTGPGELHDCGVRNGLAEGEKGQNA